MIQLEKNLEMKLRKTVGENGGVCLKWVCPGWSGVPDRIVLLPKGRVIFVETKREKSGRVNKMQAWWAEQLERLGFHHWFMWSEDDLRTFAKIELETDI